MILKKYVKICIMIMSDNNDYDKTSKLLLKTKQSFDHNTKDLI